MSWRTGAGSHLLLGDNGAGKTSLLEAVYVLATTRSFRTAHLADCCRHGERSFRLEGELSSLARARLELVWQPDGLIRRLDGATSSLADHLAVQPVVAWTSSDAELVTGAPALRRRFLDRGVVGLRPHALEAISNYRRALAQKRALLASGRGDLAPWNAVLAAAATELVRARKSYLDRLTRHLDELLGESGLPFEDVVLDYRPSPATAVEGSEAILEAFERAAVEERARKRPLLGPHRDDVLIRWRGQAVRRTVSAGERKSLGMLLTGAHGKVLEAAERIPLYLLDDADAELSQSTLASVWKIFSSARQVFLSSNRPAVWEGLGLGSVWRLDQGALGPLSSL